VEQRAALDGRHAVASAQQPLALEPDLDRIPVHAVLGQGRAQHRVGVVDAGQGRVGEDHAEAEGVVGAVALEDRDLAARIGGTGQGRGEEPSGTATDHRDAHPVSPTPHVCHSD
jgi:hypothetical protein